MKHVPRQLRAQRGGLTLVEVLAVVIILGIAATVAIPAAGGIGRGHQRLSAIGAVETAMGRARLIAENAGGATVRFGESVRVEPAGEPAVGTHHQALPAGWSAAIADERGAASEDVLEIDAWGRSRDAVIILTGPDGAGAGLRLLGLSGQLVRADQETLP